MKKLLIGVSGIGIAALLVTFLVVYQRWVTRSTKPGGLSITWPAPSGKSHGKTSLGEVSIEGPHMTGWAEDGKPLWEIWAKAIEVSEKQYTVRLLEANGKYYEKGHTVSEFKAGIIHVRAGDEQRILNMTHNVVARWGSRDVEVKSPSLVWDFGEKRIQGIDGVEFTRGRWKLTGRKILSDLSMKRVQIVGDARLVHVPLNPQAGLM